MTPRRMLVYKFLELPHIHKLEIAEELSLTQPLEDYKAETWIWLFNAVSEQKKVGELWDLVDLFADEKFPIPNPFKVEQ